MTSARSLALVAVMVGAIIACTSDDDGNGRSSAADGQAAEVLIAGPTGVFVSPVWPPPAPNAGYTGPRISTEDVASARLVVEAHPILRAILQHTSYAVEAEGPWLEDDQLAGVVVRMNLNGPLTIEADWPHVDRTEPGNWETVITHYEAHEAESLDWLVDLDADVVAGIDVVQYSTIDPN